jgi:hypothetical protein
MMGEFLCSSSDSTSHVIYCYCHHLELVCFVIFVLHFGHLHEWCTPCLVHFFLSLNKYIKSNLIAAINLIFYMMKNQKIKLILKLHFILYFIIAKWLTFLLLHNPYREAEIEKIWKSETNRKAKLIVPMQSVPIYIQLSPLTLWVQISLRRGVLDTALCDKVCQWFVAGRWFSPCTPVSFTNKTARQMSYKEIHPSFHQEYSIWWKIKKSN